MSETGNGEYEEQYAAMEAELSEETEKETGAPEPAAVAGGRRGGYNRAVEHRPQSRPRRSFEELGFKPLDTAIRHRLIICSQAHEGRGKTHFALTAPDPIAYFDFDLGTEGVSNKFAGKQVHHRSFKLRADELDELNPSEVQALYKRSWADFQEAFEVVVATASIRTIIVDTLTEAWELLRLAEFGKLSQVKPHQYGGVNAIFRTLLGRVADERNDLNAVYLHKMGKKYANDKWDGRSYARKGFGDMEYLTQTVIEHDYDSGTGEWVVRVHKCRQNAELTGDELPNHDFGDLARLVFPDSGPEDWT